MGTAHDESIPYGLSDREVTILRIVGEGYDNTEIGQRLNIAPTIARNNVHRMLRKLGGIALETGLVRGTAWDPDVHGRPGCRFAGLSPYSQGAACVKFLEESPPGVMSGSASFRSKIASWSKIGTIEPTDRDTCTSN